MINTHVRKLAAIMFTDIVGYSRIMSADENKGLELLEQHDEILTNIIEKHSGRILKKMGDALFSEFSSSVNSVNCAIEMQTALKEYNQDKPFDDKIIIRIGIHLGDVIVQGDDLFGEGINVAARLEPLAEPGGICLSQAVYQSVKSHTDVSAILVGEVNLKNIIEKYTVYKIPSLYPVDEAQKFVSSDLGEKSGVLKFKIRKVQNWLTIGRSRWLYITKWTILSYLIYSIISLALIILLSMATSSLSDYMISYAHFRDPISFINKLQLQQDPTSSFIYNKFTIKTRQIIDQYDGESKVALFKFMPIERELIDIIVNKEPLFISEYYESNPKIMDRYNQILSLDNKDSTYVFNKSVLMSSYEHELRDPEIKNFVVMFLEEMKYYEELLIVLLIMVYLFFVTSPVSIKITFIDPRDADRVLDFLTSEMGFKQSPKKSQAILYTRWWIRRWFFSNLAEIRVIVDGNIIVMTSGSLIIRRMKRLLKLHLETAPG